MATAGRHTTAILATLAKAAPKNTAASSAKMATQITAKRSLVSSLCQHRELLDPLIECSRMPNGHSVLRRTQEILQKNPNYNTYTLSRSLKESVKKAEHELSSSSLNQRIKAMDMLFERGAEVNPHVLDALKKTNHNVVNQAMKPHVAAKIIEMIESLSSNTVESQDWDTRQAIWKRFEEITSCHEIMPDIDTVLESGEKFGAALKRLSPNLLKGQDRQISSPASLQFKIIETCKNHFEDPKFPLRYEP